MTRRAYAFSSLAFLVSACSSAQVPAAGGTSDSGSDVVADAGSIVDANTEPTDGAASTDADARVPPSALKRERVAELSAFIDTLAAHSAWHEAVDVPAAKARVERGIFEGDDTEGAFLRGAFLALNQVPQGHQSLYPDATKLCSSSGSFQHYSRFGVCGRPGSGGIVVTSATEANELGLRLGDVVTALEERGVSTKGEAMLEGAYLRGACGAIFPSKAGRQASGATSFFGGIDEGMTLLVRAVDGSERRVSVPTPSASRFVDCTDPFRRNREVYAEATVRPDGIAVIRIPSFMPYDKAFPSENATQAEIDLFVNEYRDAVASVFARVKDSRGIIWDARGNTGGITPVGLAIVGGIASARAMPLSYCKTRIEGSQPPAFESFRYASYAIAKGGPFTTNAKVALVVDGLAYSAGDYFARAFRVATDAPVVGTESSGSFGGGFAPVAIKGPPALTATYDPTACFDATTNAPMEGNPLAPTLAVEYEAKAVAEGKDNVLEAAVTALAL